MYTVYLHHIYIKSSVDYALSLSHPLSFSLSHEKHVDIGYNYSNVIYQKKKKSMQNSICDTYILCAPSSLSCYARMCLYLFLNGKNTTRVIHQQLKF